MKNLFSALKGGVKLKKNASTKTHINGIAVVTETTITLKNTDQTMSKFREFTLTDGSVVREPMGIVAKPQHVIDQENGFYTLMPKFFDAEKNRWLEASTPTPVENESFAKEFKLLSYNVWFSKINATNRCHAVLDIIQHHSPDVACLQEVTPEFIDILTQNEFIRNSFFLSDSTGTTLRGGGLKYGVVMLLKKSLPVAEMKIYTIASNMNRRPLVGRIILKTDKMEKCIAIATSHLESLGIEKSKVLRRSQQDEIFRLLNEATKDFDSSLELFCGDFNYDPEYNKDEKYEYPEGFQDSVQACEGDQTTFVEDNGLGIRIDRVLFRGDNHECVKHEVLGKEENVPMAEEELNSEAFILQKNIVQELAKRGENDIEDHSLIVKSRAKRPSDHFGLFTIITDNSI